MQFPESWLRAFCNPPISSAELAETLTMAGLEVEERKPVAPPFSRVVVGAIVAVEPHPNADRLRVCQVDVGQESPLTIVCGAPNARAGIRVPCALVGAVLPAGEDGKPFVIQLGKLRGVESQGMLCSGRELHLSEDHGGLLELADDALPGQDLRSVLNLDDTLLTLKLTPNLAHCLSVYGVARELAALTGAPLLASAPVAIAPTCEDRLAVRISAPDLCGRFSGRVLRNVNTRARTPQWMVDRLARCGQRSVTALVDISNYVMFELGQPSHIFDLEKIHGALDVRWGKAGETLKLLNGNSVTVDERVGVIADDVQVESLAGIMGGDATAVSDDTRHIYVEAAFWWPGAVAGRSRRYNFSTDAGHRFERGVDPSATVQRLERITQLILEICATPQTQCGPVDDQQVAMPQPQPVRLRVARASKVIGMPVTQAQCVDVLQRLGLPLTQTEGEILVTPPAYRFDLRLEEDLIEEVVRVLGYASLPATPPLAPVAARVRSQALRSPFALRRSLAALGYQETINYSFVDERWEHELAGNPDPVRLQNPIAKQMGVMRSSLLGSLIQVLKFNQARKAARVRVFEIGRVFLRDASVLASDSSVQGFAQPMRIAALSSGAALPLQWGDKERAVDFFDAKGEVQTLLAPLQAQFLPAAHPAMHPGRCAQVLLDGRCIGYVGELHPQWRQAYELASAPMLLELELDAVLARKVPQFAAVPRFQAVQRDLAVVVGDGVTHAALMAAVWAAPTQGLLRDAELFDVYRPKASSTTPEAAAERSLALRLTLNSADATLADEQIDSVVGAVLQQLQSALGARPRA